jgi:hypothetical protein
MALVEADDALTERWCVCRNPALGSSIAAYIPVGQSESSSRSEGGSGAGDDEWWRWD